MADDEQLFRMDGAREILEVSRGAVRIEEQIKAVEEAVVKTPSLAFDLARSLVESVCKTILKDLGENCDNMGFNDLLEAVYRRIQTLPATHSEREDIKQAIERLLKHLNEAIWGLSELRHQAGSASHGRDAFEPPLDRIQAEFAARAADAIVCFLFKAYRSYRQPSEILRFEYGDFEEFDNWIDEQNEIVRIFELEYRPSEVLFHVDRRAYHELMVQRSTGVE